MTKVTPAPGGTTGASFRPRSSRCTRRSCHAATVGTLKAWVWSRMGRRRSRSSARRWQAARPSSTSGASLATRPPHPPHHYRVAVYFADGAVNMYQMRQWYKPLAELAKLWPVVVLSRTATGAQSAARRGLAARRVRADGARSRAVHRRAGHPRRAVRQPEHAQLPDVPLRAALARVHQPRRVRQDVHDHEPVQGVRLRVHRGGCRARAPLAGAVGLRPRPPRDRDRPSAGRPLLRQRCRTRRTTAPSCSTRRRGRAIGRRRTTARSSRTARRSSVRCWRPDATA